MEPSNSCAACGTTVLPEELAQGLAVKVSGRLLCPLCLDRLPGDAKVLVNQMRALRGMSVTTYRYFSGRHPGLPLFTFTTAALLLGHRRKLVHGESFDAPPLPPPGSRPRLPSAAEAGRGDRTGWISVAGISILLITGIVWLAVPASRPRVEQPPPVLIAPPPTAPVMVDPPTRNRASELTELSRRLASTPSEARSIADAAELLRDSLAPREIALRNRADTLRLEALAVADAQQPKPQPPPVPEPQTPVSDAKPLAVAPTPPQQPTQPTPQPQPKELLPVTPPAPLPEPIAAPTAPVAEPVKTVKPPKPPKPPKPAEAMPCDVTVVWPKGVKPLLEPGGLPLTKELPWPWPSGEAIHAPGIDLKKGKRLAIELSLPGVSADGGATLVVHPGKAERTQLSVCWTNGTATAGQQTIELSGLRWHAIAIPATGTTDLGQEQLRLRLEDVRDLGDSRPFLIAGASTRSAGAPLASDHPPALPLLLPPAFDNAKGWTTFRTSLRGLAGKMISDRQFAFAMAKVLLPQTKDCRSVLRKELAALRRIDSLPNGNPDDLPAEHADFASPLTGWPADGMGDLAEHPALAFGWRAGAWGGESDLGRRLDNLIGKMLTADKRLRRPAVVPVLVLGEIGFASADERKEIDRFWLDQALRLAGLGVPVIDLRQAQSANGAEQIQARAAMLLADGLRQLDWLVKL